MLFGGKDGVEQAAAGVHKVVRFGAGQHSAGDGGEAPGDGFRCCLFAGGRVPMADDFEAVFEEEDFGSGGDRGE